MLAETIAESTINSTACDQPTKWYVLRIETSCEARVARRVADMGFGAYFPVSRQSGPQRHGLEPSAAVDRPVMPGYVFCELPAFQPRFDLFMAASAAEANGLQPLFHSLGFLALDGEPIALRPGAVEDLRERETSGDFDLIIAGPRGKYLPSWCKSGRGVRITQGPFAGFPGTIERTMNHRLVRVQVMIFGRLSPMELPLAFVERVRAPMPGSLA
jgi:transcription antitermination factor NusG